MKKLVLKGSITEMLTRAQMKQVIGGSTCSGACEGGGFATCSGTTCVSSDYDDTRDGWCQADSNPVTPC